MNKPETPETPRPCPHARVTQQEQADTEHGASTEELAGQLPKFFQPALPEAQEQTDAEEWLARRIQKMGHTAYVAEPVVITLKAFAAHLIEWGKIGYKQADEEYKRAEATERENQELRILLGKSLPYVEYWQTANEEGWIEKKKTLLIKLEAVLARREKP